MARSKQRSYALVQGLMKAMLYLGVGLILLSVVLLTADLVGLINVKELLHLDGSPLKTYARIAVSGCLLASIGSLQPTLSSEDHNTP